VPLRGYDPLKLETWLPMYKRICDDFGFDPQEDLRCAQLLGSMLGDKGTECLSVVRKKFPESVLVCGGGPGLSEELSALTIEGYVVAADSATTVLAEAEIRPSMIVSDLDGIVEDQVELNEEGTVVFVHAHGDNRDAVERYVRDFKGPVVGTCQCVPPAGMYNFGGFTDGDRAACICAELGAKRIHLAGFDFENPSEKIGKDRDIKKRKLRWAKKIIDELVRIGVEVLPANDALGSL
jgi:uncharacterized Rossmann fold enzyme